METLQDNLKSASWWLGVVLVSILINIISAYLKSRTDSLFSKFSTKWRLRSIARKEAEKAELDYLQSNPCEHVFLGLQELRHRVRSGAYLVFGFMLGTFGIPLLEQDDLFLRASAVFFMLLAIVALLISGFEHSWAVRLQRLLTDARKSKYAVYF